MSFSRFHDFSCFNYLCSSILILPLVACSGGAGGPDSTDAALLVVGGDLSLSDFSYKGAFIMGDTYGDFNTRGASGAIELSADKSSFYFAGRKIDTVIGEFELPELVVSDNIADLNEAIAKQNYSSIIGTQKDSWIGSRIPTGNPQTIDRITGLMLYNGVLVANTTKYYDGTTNNSHTSLLISNPSDLANSDIYGFFSLEGAAHASGWMSEIPPEWQETLGASIITGWASNFPISARNSVGPSAFTVNLKDIDQSVNTDNLISTTALMDYSLEDPLHPDIYNNNETERRDNQNQDIVPVTIGNNDLWTVVSWAVYGFIVPGTHTYAVFGSSGGHYSGLGYKILQDGATMNCPGPCAVKPDDYYNYYWFFDVDDLVAVKQGEKLAHEVRPYSYGVFPMPFQAEEEVVSSRPQAIRSIRGGDYDSTSSTLYLVLGGSLQEDQIIVAYNVAAPK